MSKKIALAALSLMLGIAWGALPTMACDFGKVERAEQLITKAEMQSPEMKAFLGEARRLLAEAEMAAADAARPGKTARVLAEEIAGLNTP